MPATVQYLQLDATYDPIFDPTANLLDLYAVNQNILTRLRLLLGEWWEDLNLGLPVFQQMLGKLASSQGLAAMSLTAQQNIESTPYVTAATDVGVTFINGALGISYTADTLFGTVSGSTTPAISAFV